ncbi:MAG TPA: type IV secretion system DNA-binding domain-containing protein [Solirubrobacteraceae bacterium]|nr:type IV secretion system DNA-binding domain-containing protein [Solirubrobacteraceae bacterium]
MSSVEPERKHRRWTEILEGDRVETLEGVVGSPRDRDLRAVIEGTNNAFLFNKELLSTHVLFLGSIGSGKTNAMEALFHSLRDKSEPDDVFVVFDTKGDFLADFYQDGDAVITNTPDPGKQCVTWNIFNDLFETGASRVDESFELASTIFADQLGQAGENFFFAAAARDVLAAVLETMARGEMHRPRSNKELREQLESTQRALYDLLREQPDLAGTASYLVQERLGQSVLAFLQQAVRAAFSGTFRDTGDFSVRQFVREKQARALFVEYDIAKGAVLLPIYRVLLDLAIKEALSRKHTEGNVFFLMDEFALLPELSHLADGINFGRSLGLKFVVATQNVSQVYSSYGEDIGTSILSGFGTVFAFRLMDAASRSFVSERYGRNRKRIIIEHAVRAQGVQDTVLDGNVIEDWDLSKRKRGETIASIPDGPPFFFGFKRWSASHGSRET